MHQYQLTFSIQSIGKCVFNTVTNAVSIFWKSHFILHTQGKSLDRNGPSVQNDTLSKLETGKAACLILQDLSTGFDTIYQNHLQYDYGIVEIGLQWYKSYLIGRKQTVAVKVHKSEPSPLLYGVPQGYFLGPKKYCRAMPNH